MQQYYKYISCCDRLSVFEFFDNVHQIDVTSLITNNEVQYEIEFYQLIGNEVRKLNALSIS